jgi:RNA polymerase sigma-70 factor (ECF subfamily)
VESRLSIAQLREATDLFVVALACAGDERAFTEIVGRRQARVRKFMYHVCRDHALGDDLAQQVFLTTWQSLRHLRAAAAFDGWLKRIMVTTWLEELRRRKLPFAVAQDSEAVAASRDGTAERLDLDAALARLSPEVRLCIVLSYNEGLAHPEIAALTALPLGTVKSHIARGAEKLRQLLAAYAGETP